MTDLTIKQVRAKFPQYDDLSDQQLADSIHQKFYADMAPADFYSKIGFQTPPTTEPTGFQGQNQALEFPAPPMVRPRARPEPDFGEHAPPGMPQIPGLSAQAPTIDFSTPPAPPVSAPVIEPPAQPDPLISALSALAPSDDARAARGFGRSAYLDGLVDAPQIPGAGDILPPQPAVDIVSVMAPPSDFDGESFGDLAKRRGQEVAQGASGVLQSVARARGIDDQTLFAGIQRSAPDNVKEAARQVQAFEDILTRGISGDGQSPMSDDERAVYQQRLEGAAQAVQQWADVAEFGPAFAGNRAAGAEAVATSLKKWTDDTFGVPPKDESFWSQLAQGAGSMVGFMLPTIAAGPLGTVATAQLGADSAKVEAYDRAKQSGASDRDAQTAAAMAGYLGTLEAVPIASALRKLPEPIRKDVMGRLGRFISQSAKGSIEEATQEAFAAVGQNMIAKGTYDPQQKILTPDVGEQALVGAILGGVMGGGANAVGLNRREDEASPDPLARAMTEAPEQPASPDLEAAMTPAASVGEENSETRDSRPAQAPTQPTSPAQNDGRFEIMDEVETVDGETRATGRKVRVNLETGQVSPVEPDSAPDQREAVQSQPQDASDVGTDDAPAAGEAERDEAGDAGSEEANKAGEQATSTIRTQTLTSEEVGRVETDAKTFQYKDNGDQDGVTDRLQGISDWDERSAMGGIVFEYNDGRRVVADGHQRLGLAKRLQQNGKQTPWNVEVIREADGFTPADVRRIAALKNIREGSGTAIDAAKVLREAPNEIDSLNLPPKSALVRDAKGLSRLSDDAFGMVINEVVKPEWGAVVGENVADPKLHADVIDLLKKLQPKNNAQAAMIAQQAGQQAVTETQSSLFGDEEVSESLYLERAKVLDNALKRLKQDRQTFKVLSDRAGTIAEEGNVLNSDANAQRVEADSKAAAYLAAEANRKGPISDALTAAARDFKANPRQGSRIVREFLAAIRNPDAGPVAEGSGSDSRSADPTPEPRQERSEPEVEATPEGQQTLIPGVDPVSDRQRAEVEMTKAKSGRDDGPGSGRDDLFGEPEDRRDFFDQEPVKSESASNGNILRRATNAIREKYQETGDQRPNNARDISTSPQGRQLYEDLAAADSLEDRMRIADDFVREQGLASGSEILVALSHDGTPIEITKGDGGNVNAAPFVYRAAEEGEVAYTTHNHPMNSSLSLADVGMSAIGFGKVQAVGHNGTKHQVEFSPENRKMFDDEFHLAYVTVEGAFKASAQAVEKQLVADGVPAQAVTRVRDAIVILGFDRLGIVEYSGDAQAILDKHGVNLDEYIETIDNAAGPRLRRHRPDERSKGDQGTDRGSAADGSDSTLGQTAPRNSDRGTGARRNDGGEGVEQDFSAALDDVFGAAPDASSPKAKRAKADIAKDMQAILRGLTEDIAQSAVIAEKYQSLTPLFIEAMDGIDPKSGDRRGVFVAMIRPLADAGLTREDITALYPYFTRFLNDVESGRISLEGADDAPSPGGDLERDRGDTETGDRLGGADVPPAARGNGPGADSGRGTPDTGSGERQGGGRVSDGNAPAVGAEGDQGVSGPVRDEGQPADGGVEPGGRDRGQQGLPADPGRAEDTERHASDTASVGDRRATQRSADKVSVKPGDRDNIDKTLPLLLPEQRDDVWKVEQRFSKPDGHGMLITNGTGTGKTYSGGGVIKRFTQQGKDNILILAPSQGILDAWVDMGSDMGIDISKLDDTKGAGKGVVATTYANAAENNELATRDWDLVVTDESQKLSQNAAGDATSALTAVRAITNRPEDLWKRARMVNAEAWTKWKDMPGRDSELLSASQAQKAQEIKEAKRAELNAKDKALIEKWKSQPRSKVLFLSATPFAYDKNVDYGAGYLFEYGEGGTTESGSRQDGRNLFMVENFGYRIRYHKLTKPEAAVDTGVFEREFHERLKREGVLSGRQLDIPTDYDRKFVKITSADGEKIDAAMRLIMDKSDNTPAGRKWRELGDHVRRNFTYLRRLQLLEAIKAEASIPDIKAHVGMGRKVVVFHDYNKGGGFNPFMGSDVVTPTAKAMEGYKLLLAEMPEVADLNFSGLGSPIETLTAAFGKRARVYNGTVSQKERKSAKDDFNADGSDVNVIIVQSAAGEAGISLHDTTGGHQRALINLGMPVRPTTTLQEEGRIRRVGSVSDAVFRYYTTGTAWERQAFAGKIAENSGTVENLALGNEARAIREAFISAYMDADTYQPSLDDGKGGRDSDRSTAKTSPYDQAKTHYFARTKNTRRRNQRQGFDFYSTPEPLGYKMAEWAGIRTYEKALEPSAGDGAIARYLPGDADRTIIEPSLDLITKAQLRAPGAKTIQERFEDHHIVNKYDAVVMNPPFGSGGKTAMEHMAKAARHLKPGGRLVALVPTGPAADKQLARQMVDGEPLADLQWSADISLPAVTFEKAGTNVAARVVIFDKTAPDEGHQTKRINMTGAQTIADFFERLEGISAPERPAVSERTAEVEQVVTPPAVESPGFDVFSFFHTKTGKNKHGVQITEKLGDRFKEVASLARANGGYYSRYQNKAEGIKRGFLFDSEADRQTFMDDIQKPQIGFEEAVHDAEVSAEVDIKAMRGELDRLNLKRVNIEGGAGGDRLGAFRADTNGALTILIAPSLDPMATLHHEAIHALRTLDLFTPAEWRALEIKAAKTWVDQYDIPTRYPDLLPSEQIEEAIAEAFANRKSAGHDGSLLARAFAKIARLMEAIGNAVRGGGFQTVDDVFSRVASGEVGGRDDGGSGFASKFKEARAPLPKRQTAQQQAHGATAMGANGGFAFIPDRRIWEELSASNAGYWQRLRNGAVAANDWIDKARIKMQDRFLPVLRAQEAIIRQTGQALPEQHNAYLAEETFSGKVGRHLFEIDEDYTKAIIDIMAGDKGEPMLDSEYVGTWLYARHAQERNARIASINPNMPDGGSGMTDADAAQILADAGASPHAGRLQEIGQIIDDLRERTLKLREDAGLITADEADIWRNQYKFYVPLKGFADTDHSEAMLDVAGVGRRFNTRGAESKRALGRQSEAFNPLQAAITQAQEVAIRAEKNRVGQALYKLAKDHPSPKLWTVKTPKQKRFYNRTTGLVETRVEDPVSLIMDPNEMAVKVAGKERRILFHDIRLAQAAGTVGADQMNWFIGLMSKASRWFSSVNTMLDPEFVIRNAFRDMTAAQINIRNFGKADRNALAKAMVKNWPKAWRAAYRGQMNRADSEWTKYYREFEKAGAKVSFWKLEQPEAERGDLERRIKMAGGNMAQRASRFARISTRDNPVLGFIERVNLAVDNAVRLAAYVEARKQGWSQSDAASLSKNLTVNFNRRGEWGASINALYPFANAGIQGTQILFRAMTSKRMAKYAIGMVALGMILDQVNASLSEEDDDGELAYDKIPDWKNQMNLVVMLGPDAGNAATLWLPYGYNLFPYMGQQISKISRGVKGPGDAMADFAGAVFGSFSPLGGRDLQSVLTPTMLDPINEMAMNKDWLGRPIRPESPFADYGPDAYKYYAGVSSVSREIANAANRTSGGTIAESGMIDVSPEYIDHAFGFVTGGAGRFVGRTTDTLGKIVTGEIEDIEARNIPFYRSLQYKTGDYLDRDRYYRFREEVREAREALKTYQAAKIAPPTHIRRMAGLYDTLKITEKSLRASRKQKRGLAANSNLTAAEKSRRRANIEAGEATRYLGFNKIFVRRIGRQGE